MPIAKLSIDLEAKLANLQAGLDKAGLLAERQAERMQRAFAGASKALVAAGGALGAALSVSVITRWVNATVDGMDALNDLADATGSSVENLSALEDVALRAGTSMETAGDAVVKMNKALADAKPGSDAARAFEALGLSVAELKRLDPVEAFQKLAIALQGFANDGNKARLVQELFGKSLKEVAPLLKDVAEAGTLQAKVTKEQAEEAEKFNKQIAAMQKSLLDLSRALAGPVVSALNETIDSFRRATAEGSTFLQWVDKRWRQSNGGGDTSRISGIAKEIEGLDSSLGNAMLPPQIRAQFQQRRDALAKQLDELQAGAKSAFLRGDKDTTQVALPSVGDTSGGGNPKRAPKAKADLQDIVGPEMSPALKDALKLIEDADENKLIRLHAELDQLLSIAQSGVAVPDSAFAKIAEDIAKLDPAARAAQREIDRLAEDQKRLNDILGDTPTGKMDALLEKIAFINAQFAAGKIPVEQWAEAIRTATGTMDNDVKQAADKGIDAARELGLTFSSAFEDAIVGGKGLRDVLKGLEDDILRIVTRKLVTEPLAGATTDFLGSLTKGGTSGGIGGFLTEIGSKFSGLFSGFFADGGFIPPGRWGVAGERGPEPVFGGRTGATVRPAGGHVINISVTGAQVASRETTLQNAAMLGRQVSAAMARNG